MKSPTAAASRRNPSSHHPALKIALAYAVVSVIWIIGSDTALYYLSPDDKSAEVIGIIKGCAFVAVTAAILWWVVRRMLIRLGASEKELRASEERLRAVLNGVGDAIFVHEAGTGKILEVNLSASRMFGYSRDEFQALQVEDISSGVEPYTQQRAMGFIASLAGKKEATIEWHSRTRDGRLFWTEVSARSEVIGGQARVFVTVRDISKRKRAADEVRKLSRAVEQSPASIIITNRAGEIEYANPAACMLTGYAPGELLGKNPKVLKSGHTSPEEYRRLWETICGGGEWHGEFLNQNKNGDLYWEAAIISPVTDERGEITHFVAVKEDITGRKRMEQALQESEADYRFLFENMLNGFAYCRMEYEDGRPADFTYLRVNAAFEKLTGLKNVEGRKVSEVVPGIRETDPVLFDIYAETARTGKPHHFETHVTALAMWFAISVYRPAPGHFVAVFDVITERKRAEQELRDSRVRLRALLARLQDAREQERTRIAREVHDVLGQLVTGMKMDLSWLERRLPRIADEELRADITQKITATTALTDSMLGSVQKISRDLRPSLLDNLGLSETIQSEVRLFSERTGMACEITSLPVSLEMPPDHATHVFRIFQEILTNVARHSRATRVRVDLARKPEGLKLTVEDNGCGISPAAMQDPASLGLLGMSERAALLGGRVGILGVPGGGTSVTLTLPAEPA